MPGRTFLGYCVPREREHAHTGDLFRSHSSNKNGSEGALRNLPSEVCVLEQWMHQERAGPWGIKLALWGDIVDAGIKACGSDSGLYII